MKKEIITVADLCVDLLFVGDVKPVYGQVEQFVNDYTVELGGSTAIFSSQFTKLGGNVKLIGKVGKDVFGDYLIERLSELNIPPDGVIKSPSEKTAVGLGLAYHGDRAMLTYSGAMSELSGDEILATGLLDHPQHVHITSYYLLGHLHDFWREQVPLLKKRGTTISLDTNWSPFGDWKKVHSILSFVDVFIPNEQEALHISGQSSVMDAGKWLRDHCELTVIKRGAEGAVAFGKQEKITPLNIPSLLTRGLKIADTTGAGDNFDAGFMSAWLSRKELEECILDGMICGTMSLSKVGGIT
ncbi:MAG TPA: carbohydrate kinase family protein, partial [Cyclobacteriaceae bacterium]|nr:carbohydrate kinase family protein [Cyclobacteriaceae bacterium]